MLKIKPAYCGSKIKMPKIINPLIVAPNVQAKTADQNDIDKNTAIAEPVHTPVKGNGTEIKATTPQNLLFGLIFLDLVSNLAESRVENFLNPRVLDRAFNVGSKIAIIIMPTVIFPNNDAPKAHQRGNPCATPNGKPPRNSITGNIEIRKVCNRAFAINVTILYNTLCIIMQANLTMLSLSGLV